MPNVVRSYHRNRERPKSLFASTTASWSTFAASLRRRVAVITKPLSTTRSWNTSNNHPCWKQCVRPCVRNYNRSWSKPGSQGTPPRGEGFLEEGEECRGKS